MAKFIWLEVVGGGLVPVNPDQVQYLRRTREGATAIVFGAFNGGVHELLVADEAGVVVHQLEGGAPGAAAPKPGSPDLPGSAGTSGNVNIHRTPHRKAR